MEYTASVAVPFALGVNSQNPLNAEGTTPSSAGTITLLFRDEMPLDAEKVIARVARSSTAGNGVITIGHRPGKA
jgi:hypothetical protein